MTLFKVVIRELWVIIYDYFIMSKMGEFREFQRSTKDGIVFRESNEN